MKNLKATIIIIGLLLVGVISVFIYKQQQENRISEFEGYELAMLEDKVAELYNTEKTDLAADVSEEQMSEVGRLLDGKTKKEYSQVLNDFEDAQAMFKLQDEIHNIFEDELHKIVKANVSLNTINHLENELEVFKDKTLFYERNLDHLELARGQIGAIEEAKEYVERLFEDGELREDVTEEDIERVEILIHNIENKNVKDNLLARLDGVEIVTEEETDTDEQEDELEDEEETVEEADEAAPPRQEPRQPASRPTNPRPSNPPPTSPETPDLDEQPDPEPTPEPDPEPAPKDPEPEPKPEDPNPEPEPSPEPPESDTVPDPEETP